MDIGTWKGLDLVEGTWNGGGLKYLAFWVIACLGLF
jgi:hypothetical protein